MRIIYNAHKEMSFLGSTELDVVHQIATHVKNSGKKMKNIKEPNIYQK